MEQVLSSVAGIVTAAESIAGTASQPPNGRAPSGPAPSQPAPPRPAQSGAVPPGSTSPGAASPGSTSPRAVPSGPVLRRDDFAATRPLVAGLLREHAGLAAGAGVVLAPHTVADAVRCIEWWWADQSARIVPLEVDLDPESAEFYDYTTTDWYREPERTGAPTLAGPYVDFICTHEYTFTLAAPVRPRPGHRLDQREPAPRCGAAPPAPGRGIRPTGRARPAAAGGPGAGARPAAVDAARCSRRMITGHPA